MSGCSSLGEALGVEVIPAPHSSVAVRDRQRRDEARAPGHRGINGRGLRVRSEAKRAWEAVRLCRERPLHPRARRYGSHKGERRMRGGLDRCDEGCGRSPKRASG